MDTTVQIGIASVCVVCGLLLLGSCLVMAILLKRRKHRAEQDISQQDANLGRSNSKRQTFNPVRNPNPFLEHKTNEDSSGGVSNLRKPINRRPISISRPTSSHGMSIFVPESGAMSRSASDRHQPTQQSYNNESSNSSQTDHMRNTRQVRNTNLPRNSNLSRRESWIENDEWQQTATNFIRRSSRLSQISLSRVKRTSRIRQNSDRTLRTSNTSTPSTESFQMSKIPRASFKRSQSEPFGEYYRNFSSGAHAHRDDRMLMSSTMVDEVDFAVL